MTRRDRAPCRGWNRRKSTVKLPKKPANSYSTIIQIICTDNLIDKGNRNIVPKYAPKFNCNWLIYFYLRNVKCEIPEEKIVTESSNIIQTRKENAPTYTEQIRKSDENYTEENIVNEDINKKKERRTSTEQTKTLETSTEQKVGIFTSFSTSWFLISHFCVTVRICTQ